MGIKDLTVTIRTPSRAQQSDPAAVSGGKRYLPAVPLPCFWGGDTIEGDVTAEVTEQIKVKRVVVVLSGVAQCSWTTGTGEDKQTHSAYRSLVKKEAVLWEPDSKGGCQDTFPASDSLPVGYQRWSFSLQLPPSVPSSWVVSSGSVHYCVKAKIKVKRGFNKKAVSRFNVEEQVDVTRLILQEPLTQSANKHLCCCCCKSGPISLRASINKQGFYYGDTVEVSDIYAQNMSRRNLGHVRVQLHRVCQLKASDGETQTTSHALAEVSSHETLRAGDDITIPRLSLKIENFGCSIQAVCVRVWVAVHVTLVVPRGINLSVDLPLAVSPLRPQQEPPSDFHL